MGNDAVDDISVTKVSDFYGLAKARMEQSHWDYYDSGAMGEITLAANRSVYADTSIVNRVLRNVGDVDTRVRILDAELSAPLFVAPMAFQKLAHDAGETGTARAADTLGIGLVLSTLSTTSIEEVSQCMRVRSNQWMQLYVHKDRMLTRAVIDRAVACGFSAICVTVDAPELGKRERDHANRFTLPKHLGLPNIKMTDHVSSLPESEQSSGLFDYFRDQIDPSLTWSDIEEFIAYSPIPIVLKGVLHPEDVRIAETIGVSAVVISNHGGRQLDTSIDTLHALDRIVQSASPGIPLLVDGGIRRGSDILKALCCGAKAVLVGRPFLWGLAANGCEGALTVAELLFDELRHSMRLIGASSLEQLSRDMVILP